MSQLQERIAQFRKMANDDPENELGHFRLGQLLMEAREYDEAIKCFRRTLELSPHFSKVYQLLGSCQVQLHQREAAIQTLTDGFQVADERGDRMPRDEMAALLTQLGAPTPVSKRAPAGGAAETGGFVCQRPGCMWGSRARQLPKPPMSDAVGQRIQATVCADC